MQRLYRKDKPMTRKAEKIEEMFATFDSYPLVQKDEFDKFYVNTNAARGSNVVKLMEFGLKYSQNPYMKILFMGHRGSGKSTELSLLKDNVKDDFEVISFFIQDEVDTDSMTYIDFIFAIMSRLIRYIDEKNLDLESNDLEGLYKYWYGEKIIEETEFDYGELAVDFKAKLSFLKKISLTGGGIFKTGAESKTSIRRKMEPKIGYLVELMNQIFQKINNLFLHKNLLIIIEDLDKLSLSTAEELFINHRKTWLSLKIRLIVTFPIFMAYNAHYNMIKEDVELCCMLSMIKVRNQDKTPNAIGISTLKEIISKRADLSLFESGDSDESNVILYLIMKSGGAIRDLFQMIRDASFNGMLGGHTQITMENAQKAYQKLKSENERLIRSESDIDKLLEIYQTPRPRTTDNTVMELLLKGLILEYNGERWCGIHPTIEDFLIEKGIIEAND